MPIDRLPQHHPWENGCPIKMDQCAFAINLQGVKEYDGKDVPTALQERFRHIDPRFEHIDGKSDERSDLILELAENFTRRLQRQIEENPPNTEDICSQCRDSVGFYLGYRSPHLIVKKGDLK